MPTDGRRASATLWSLSSTIRMVGTVMPHSCMTHVSLRGTTVRGSVVKMENELPALPELNTNSYSSLGKNITMTAYKDCKHFYLISLLHYIIITLSIPL